MESGAEEKAGECISGNLAVCAFIERSHLFKGLKKKDFEVLYSSGRLLQYRAGEVIIREGDAGREMFVVMTGTVRVVTGTKQAPVELAQLKRGAFFGEVSLLTGRPRTATVVAIDEVELIAFQKQDMEPILRKYPRVRKLMKLVVEGRVRTAIEKACGHCSLVLLPGCLFSRRRPGNQARWKVGLQAGRRPDPPEGQEDHRQADLGQQQDLSLQARRAGSQGPACRGP